MGEGSVLRDSIRFAAVCVAVLVAEICAAGRAPAQVTTEHGASIVVFPDVIADAAGDTVIQLANLSAINIDASCSYIGGTAGTRQSLTFSIAIGPNRPVHWTAARGSAAADGIDVPAAPASFQGELLCVQVDLDGAPLGGDDLAGEATLVDLASGSVAAYAAAGLRGATYMNDRDNVLCIGGQPFQPSDNCPIGAEYDGCPAEWILSVAADGAADAQLGAGSQLSTRLAVAPCSQDLSTATPGTVDIDVTVFNELAEHFTAPVSVPGWADLSLADISGQIFTRGRLGTDFAQASFQPAVGSGGFILVAQTMRSTGGAAPIVSSAAINLHHQGSADTPDAIVLP